MAKHQFLNFAIDAFRPTPKNSIAPISRFRNNLNDQLYDSLNAVRTTYILLCVTNLRDIAYDIIVRLKLVGIQNVNKKI